MQKAGLLSTLDEKTGLITAALHSMDARTRATKAGIPEVVQMELGSVSALIDRREWVVMHAAPELHNGTLYLPLEDICRLLYLPLTKATKDTYR